MFDSVPELPELADVLSVPSTAIVSPEPILTTPGTNALARRGVSVPSAVMLNADCPENSPTLNPPSLLVVAGLNEKGV